MLYRGEVVTDGKVIHSINATSTNPKHIIRRMLTKIKNSSYSYVEIYVLNDEGQVWHYTGRKVGSIYKVTLIRKPDRYLTEDIKNSIFAGNKTIREVLR